MSTKSILLTGLLLFSLEYLLLCLSYDPNQNIIAEDFPVENIVQSNNIHQVHKLSQLLKALNLNHIQLDSINPSTTQLKLEQASTERPINIYQIAPPSSGQEQVYKVAYNSYTFEIALSSGTDKAPLSIQVSQNCPFLLKAWFSLTNSKEKIPAEIKSWIERFSEL